MASLTCCAVILLFTVQYAAAELDYAGCFRDNADTPAMDGPKIRSPAMSNIVCVAICTEKGYKYAGTSDGVYCFCGNSYDKYGEGTGCNTICSGAGGQVCGGTLFLSVYNTGESGTLTAPPEAKYLGCWTDTATRVLNVLWTTSDSMTNALCHSICLSQGTRYAGTQYKTNCFCGDVYKTFGESTACNTQCQGNTAEICGGAFANSVYEITDSANVPVSLCQCSGDPHCRSFDGRMMHFQGKCEYVLARDKCDGGVATANEPDFLVRQVQWSGNNPSSPVSWVKQVTVEAYGHEILLGNAGVVRLDGVEVNLPAYILPDPTEPDNPDVIITLKGIYMTAVLPKLGVEVRYDGRHVSQVLVAEKYRDQTCGHCGNFNGNGLDDWTIGEGCKDVGYAAGAVVTNYNVFGHSWLYSDVTSNNEQCKCDDTPPDPCPGGDQATADASCNELYGANGRFKDCVAKMETDTLDGFLAACVFDMCALNNDPVALCESGEALAATCAYKYATRVQWRDENFCPLNCAEGMSFNPCTNPIQASCADLNPAKEGECVEACVCSPGFVLLGQSECIPADECGCQRNGLYYKVGETAVAEDCSEVCTCEEVQGELQCTSLTCHADAVCEPREGVRDCYCKEGYGGNGKECVDIDECAIVLDGCDHECTNTVGSFQCSCRTGFILGNDGKTCSDVDECAQGTADCDQNCANTEGSFECSCNDGFKLQNDGTTCVDIDECAVGVANCDHTCTNLPGNFQCECDDGFKLEADGKTCTDIDECATGTAGCNQDCRNLEGSFQCICHYGFKLNADGKTCVAVPTATCSCSGDPHCTSFDGVVMHFQGICEYIYAQDGCENGVATGAKPNFVVKQRQHLRWPGATVSFVQEVTVEVYGQSIKIGQGRVVTVDGQQVNLPAYPIQNKPDVEIIMKGAYVAVVVPEFGLEVRFEGNHISMVLLQESNKGNVCGHCGNYNGVRGDDWTVGENCQELNVEAGTVATDFSVFGHSWLVPEEGAVDESCKCAPTPPDPCEGKRDAAESICNDLYGINGRFQECMAVMEDQTRQNNYDSCVFDMCAMDGTQEAVCNSAEALALTCAFEYFVQFSWRDVDFCPPECPQGKTYNPCTNPKQPSCVNRNPAPMPDPERDCVENCVCEAGTILDGDDCIPEEQCGCQKDGLYYKEGQSVVTRNCEEKCVCEAGKMVCEPMNCDANSECKVNAGSRTCVCVDGYTGDGKQCTDINECELGTDDCTQICKNVDGSFQCTCREGFRLEDDGRTCTDINECAEGTAGCENCQNTLGSFECLCDTGYELADDGVTCIDINECALDIDGCHQRCRNTQGSFRCRCKKGWELLPDKINCQRKQQDCTDALDLFAQNGIPVEDPTYNWNCEFDKKQCNLDLGKCWCVKPDTGELLYPKVVFPPYVDYDCSYPAACLRRRFEALLEDPDQGYIPDCKEDGFFKPMQCDTILNECWCVRKKGGEIDGTRVSGEADCSAYV